ncbi:MAG TPA: hypothetical protein VLA19_15175 [Herpetosiphonaceae bacterium]|nr:hypothetical protein [Herpetosiphonaceae bacterium]
MAGTEQAVELKLVREIDGLELDLRALQGHGPRRGIAGLATRRATCSSSPMA